MTLVRPAAASGTELTASGKRPRMCAPIVRCDWRSSPQFKTEAYYVRSLGVEKIHKIMSFDGMNAASRDVKMSAPSFRSFGVMTAHH